MCVRAVVVLELLGQNAQSMGKRSAHHATTLGSMLIQLAGACRPSATVQVAQPQQALCVEGNFIAIALLATNLSRSQLVLGLRQAEWPVDAGKRMARATASVVMVMTSLEEDGVFDEWH